MHPQQPGKPDSTACAAPLSSLFRLVREFVAQNNTVQIKHVIQTLSQEFALSQHPHSRKGGLIGLAACSIALGKVGLFPWGPDMAAMAFALTPETQQGVADFRFSAVLSTPKTRQAGSAALQPLRGVAPSLGSRFAKGL